MKKAGMTRWTAALVCAGMLLLPLGGCSALKSKEPAAPKSATTTSPTASPEKSPSNAVQENTPVYYDFGDVMLPRELKVDKKESFVFHTPGMTAGVLVLSGGVDANSLFTFFENKMPVDGWQQVSSFKAARSMMLFKKKERWCVISITDGSFSTKVQLWVAPSIEHAARGLQK